MRQLKGESVIEAIAYGDQLLNFGPRCIGSQVVQRSESDIYGRSGGKRVEIENRDRNGSFDDPGDGVGIHNVWRSEYESNEFTRGADVVQRSNPGVTVAEVSEVTRSKILGEALETGRQMRSVNVKFSPQVNATIPSVVSF